MMIVGHFVEFMLLVQALCVFLFLGHSGRFVMSMYRDEYQAIIEEMHWVSTKGIKMSKKEIQVTVMPRLLEHAIITKRPEEPDPQ